MNISRLKIPGLVVFELDAFSDDRGSFFETYQMDRYEELGATFIQDNCSYSKKGVVRGLHYQLPPFGQGKLVQVIRGSVFDVAVDIRKGSPTYGMYESVVLSEENHRQFWIPEGFAHGFLSLEDGTIFQYKCTNRYSPEHDRGIRFDDPDIRIAWPDPVQLVSQKDREHPLLRDLESPFLFHSKLT